MNGNCALTKIGATISIKGVLLDALAGTSLSLQDFREEHRVKPSRRQLLRLAAVVAAAPALRVAKAQAYPARRVRIIVGFAAGGGLT
jgi:hypothetical protein